MCRLLIQAGMALCLSACAPSGYSYGSWTDGPVAAFTVTSNDMCQRPETERSIVDLLNGKIGQPSGPVARVTSAAGLVTAPNDEMHGQTLTCRGILQAAGGAVGPGTVRLGLTDSSNSQSMTVKEAWWETDADRERREAQARREQAKRMAEAPARAAKTMNDMRTSAQREPDETVHCSISRSQFWTTNAICFALIEEAQYLSGKMRTESRVRLVEDCAKDIAQKLPGKGRPTYMNACESLVDTFSN